MTRIYAAIIIVSLCLFACSKKPKPEAAPPCCVDVAAEPIVPLLELTAQVYFDFNSDSLTENGLVTLGGVSDFLTANPAYALYVDGYADTTGRSTYNDSLSQRRADKVWLAITGIAQPRMGLSTGHGEGEERTVIVRVVP